MTLQLTKHIEPDCSMRQTQETGGERKQTKAEKSEDPSEKSKTHVLKMGFQSDSCRKACQKIIHHQLNKVYNNPPARITNQNMYL